MASPPRTASLTASSVPTPPAGASPSSGPTPSAGPAPSTLPTPSAVPADCAIAPPPASATPASAPSPLLARLRVTPGRAVALGALAVAIAALAIFGLRSHAAPPRPAPPLPTQPLVGQPVSLRSLAGKPAFVVFWASWCGPCSLEAPAIETFAREEAAHARVVGVDWDDATDSARQFARKHGWTFSSMGDPEGAVGASYGLTGLPTTFLIDAQGRIVKRLVGEQTVNSLRTALAQV